MTSGYTDLTHTCERPTEITIGIEVSFDEFLDFSNKVVAEGSVTFVLDHPVHSRVSRRSFGTEIWISYKPYLKEHKKRQSRCSQLYSGELGIPNVFSVILPKVLIQPCQKTG